MLPALEAFSEFRLTVLAYNSKGAGPESRPYTFQTPEGGEGPCVRPRGARESELRPRGLRRWLWKGPQRERLSWVLCFPVPEQPAFLKVVKVDRDAATVAWGLPEKLNGHLVGFLLQYQTSAWGLGGRGLALREPGGGVVAAAAGGSLPGAWAPYPRPEGSSPCLFHEQFSLRTATPTYTRLPAAVAHCRVRGQ